MLFDRRVPPAYTEQLRVLLWPRESWERSLRYIALRLLRVRATPHQLALGFAIGVFAAVTPLVGLQMVLAGLLALMCRASFTAAMLGTFFGNPIVWAVIWPATYATGSYVIGGGGGLDQASMTSQFAVLWESVRTLSADMLGAAFAILWPIVKPMLVGSIPVGLAIAGAFYYVTKRAAMAYQARRRRSSGYDSRYPLGVFLASYDLAWL
ncbi:MAG: DUF2062 domain-containing protein [Alphaproteobacteria bacterium]|nr:DUF2062 domain-containing protein [Alphaproteobacteria bacterium]